MTQLPLLLIDDDAELAALLRDFLGRHGYAMTWADRPSAGAAELERQAPALILLDVMLPEHDGFTVCRELRSQGVRTPIIMLTAKGDDEDKITGLQTGADDYLAKPFNPRELLARIQAVLRRAPGETAADEPAHPLDPDNRTLTLGGRTAALTPHEYRIVEVLLERSGSVYTREQLLDALDGVGAGEAFDRSIDLHISRIRHKLEADPKHPRFLVTVWGVGYKLLCSDAP